MIPHREEWQREGLCHRKCLDGTKANPWFVDPTDESPSAQKLLKYAKQQCNKCPVREQCEEFGKYEEDGIWGGLDRIERFEKYGFEEVG